MSKLNKLIPDGPSNLFRSTAVTVADLIAWLHQNRPDALKAAIKAGGEKETRKALNDLEAVAESYR